jgi:hypothetical protein
MHTYVLATANLIVEEVVANSGAEIPDASRDAYTDSLRGTVRIIVNHSDDAKSQ